MRRLLDPSFAGVLAVALAASLVSCTEEKKPVTLPTLTPTTATPTTTTGMTDHEQIEWIYAAYARGVHKAERIKDDKKRQTYLAQWLDEPMLTDRVHRIGEFTDDGYQTEGGIPKPHVAGIDLSGSKATVQTCTDQRERTTKDVSTGKIWEGRAVWQVFKFHRTTKGWRMYAVKVGEKQCDPEKY